MLFTIFCLYWVQELLQPYTYFIGCPKESGGSLLCLGVSAVYRMSMVLASLYLILIASLLFRGEIARICNEGLWTAKIV